MICLAENLSIGNAEFNRNRTETLIEYKLEHFFCHSPSAAEERLTGSTDGCIIGVYLPILPFPVPGAETERDHAASFAFVVGFSSGHWL